MSYKNLEDDFYWVSGRQASTEVRRDMNKQIFFLFLLLGSVALVAEARECPVPTPDCPTVRRARSASLPRHVPCACFRSPCPCDG
ncbi:arasin 2-like isoform X2 [Penaeus japonicus]|uniref:arasin 2-like isoform X2 n=1 Tax=Penaeus japonicus TaxID=27405 RepID=UPI001C711D82|nr:arasin 2-like isoform X2 [Penaeus japonicus]